MTKLLVSGWDRSLYQYKVIGQWMGEIALSIQSYWSVDGTDCFDHDKVIGQWMGQIALSIQSYWSVDGTDCFEHDKVIGQ